MIWDWKAKLEGQEIPRIAGKIGLGVQSEAGKANRVCQENMSVTASALLQLKRQLHTWTSPDGQY